MQNPTETERQALNAAIDALQTLHTVCVGMDLENQQERPTEAEYQAAMAQAAAAIAKATEAP